MTNPDSNPSPIVDAAAARLGAVIEERFGPLPQRDPGRAGQRVRAIAGMHALADYFAEHPDVPMPYLTRAHVRINDRLMFDQLAEHLGREVYGGGDHAQFDLAPSGPDVETQIVVSWLPARRDERPL